MTTSAYEYARIQDDEDGGKNIIREQKFSGRRWLRQNIGFIVSIMVILLWTITSLVKIKDNEVNLIATGKRPSRNFPGVNTYTSLDDSRQSVWLRYGWWSKYSTDDHLNITAVKEVDHAWDAINPGHGVVAIDHQLAADQGLPLSMSLPDDHSKGVYIIDAYHQIHCLVGNASHCWRFKINQQVDNHPQDSISITER